MVTLIIARVIQGIAAGGVFALVYIVLADVSAPETRGRTLLLASSIWGIASVLGPTLGGFIVTYLAWRWIFFIDIPLGIVSIWGIGTYLVELRPKKTTVSLDLLRGCHLVNGNSGLLVRVSSGGADLSLGVGAYHRIVCGYVSSARRPSSWPKSAPGTRFFPSALFRNRGIP